MRLDCIFMAANFTRIDVCKKQTNKRTVILKFGEYVSEMFKINCISVWCDMDDSLKNI